MNTKCVDSSKVTLSNVSWWIKFCKRTNENKTDVLDLSLMSSFDDSEKSLEWSCETRANLKLLQMDDQIKHSIEKSVKSRQFSSANPSYTILDFIEWDDFLKNYAKDSEATFEMEIQTGPLKRVLLSDIEQTSTKMHVILKNVSKLGETFSPEVTLRGIKWRVRTKKLDDFLSVSLQASESDLEMNWMYQVNCSFTLLSFKKSVEPITYTFNSQYRHDSREFGLRQFVNWTSFVDNDLKYVHNDKAILLVEFKVEEPKSLIESSKQVRAKPTLSCSMCLGKCSQGKTFASNCGHWIFCESCCTIEITDEEHWCWHCKKHIEYVHPIFY